jgi:hypothetical protein
MAALFLVIDILVTTIILVLLYQKNIRLQLSVLLTVILFTGIIMGLGLMYWQNTIIIEARSRLSWPTTEAIIIDSKVVGYRAYRPDITYEYTVDGQPYQGQTNLKTPGFGARRSRRDTAQRIIGEYKTETRTTVYYDPDNPAISFIRPGPEWSDYMKFAVGNILFIISLLGFAGNILSKFNLKIKS